MNKPIYVTKSSMPSFEEYTEEIKELWESCMLTNMGVKHKKLEAMLKVFLDCPNITLFTNGHMALECILEAFELEGEVITTPFTFPSTVHAITRKGLKPVFCDIDFYDYTIDTKKLEELVTEKTCAVLPVHIYGNLCNVEEIDRLAKKHHIKVIYDAAHAFNVTLNGINAANFGDASMFSFHATKVFNTIEGGAVTYKDENLIKRLNNLKNFGITGQESVEAIGTNAKMNEFQAAMGICNLRHITDEINKRKTVWDKYFDNLWDVKGITFQKQREGIKGNYAYFPVIFNGYKKSRDHVFEELKSNDIFARKYFYPVINACGCYCDKYDSKNTPVAEYISERVLTLPLYADLSLRDVDRICKIILE